MVKHVGEMPSHGGARGETGVIADGLVDRDQKTVAIDGYYRKPESFQGMARKSADHGKHSAKMWSISLFGRFAG
jgi:hypothetical protein